MNTMASAPAGADKPMPPRRVLGSYLAEIRSECLRYLRMPSFLLPLLLFPSAFYLFFGVLMAGAFGYGASRWLLAGYSVFAVMGAGLFGFGVSLALERHNGLLTLKRALPMPPGAWLLGKMLMVMLAAAGVVVVLLALCLLLTDVALSAGQVGGLLLTGVLGVLPFCAFGLWLGMLIKGPAAPGIVNAVYLPMAFLSGLWIPLFLLPDFLQQLAQVWPSYHLNRIALDVIGAKPAVLWPHVLVLTGFTVVFLGLAARRLRRSG